MPAVLVKDAQRHGLKIRPVDVTCSDWLCTLETILSKITETVEPDFAVRLGGRERSDRAGQAAAPAGNGGAATGALRDLLNRSIDDVGLSVRSVNSLKNSSIRTLADLVEYREEDLLKVKNVGEKALGEIADLLRREGLNFGMKIEEVDGELRVADPGAVDVNLISCVFLTTSNDCWTCGAGSNSPFPAWFASTVHVPAPTKLTVTPDTVQTAGVPDEKDTASPEVAVAVTV